MVLPRACKTRGSAHARGVRSEPGQDETQGSAKRQHTGGGAEKSNRAGGARGGRGTSCSENGPPYGVRQGPARRSAAIPALPTPDGPEGQAWNARRRDRPLGSVPPGGGAVLTPAAV